MKSIFGEKIRVKSRAAKIAPFKAKVIEPFSFLNPLREKAILNKQKEKTNPNSA